jgi:hypothetical protein
MARSSSARPFPATVSPTAVRGRGPLGAGSREHAAAPSAAPSVAASSVFLIERVCST